MGAVTETVGVALRKLPAPPMPDRTYLFWDCLKAVVLLVSAMVL